MKSVAQAMFSQLGLGASAASKSKQAGVKMAGRRSLMVSSSQAVGSAAV